MIAEALSRMAPSAIRARARGRSPRAAADHFVGKARTVPRPLAALLAMATIQVVAWILVLPPFQGPDEEAHFAYVQHLAETGERPGLPGVGGRSYSTEQAEAMKWADLFVLRGVLAARPGWAEAEEQRWREVESSLSDEASSDSDNNAAGQNPRLYYALETIPYHLAPGGSFFNRFYMARFGSAVFYVAAVAFMWLIASELFRPLWARTLATAIFGLHPKLAMLGALINPDTLLVLIWTAFIYVGLRIVRHGPSLRRLICAGGAAAASVLTHGRGLAILPALLALLGIAYLRWRPPLRQTLLAAAVGLGIAPSNASFQDFVTDKALVVRYAPPSTPPAVRPRTTTSRSRARRSSAPCWSRFPTTRSKRWPAALTTRTTASPPVSGPATSRAPTSSPRSCGPAISG